jgi:hypothetical protein
MSPERERHLYYTNPTFGLSPNMALQANNILSKLGKALIALLIVSKRTLSYVMICTYIENIKTTHGSFCFSLINEKTSRPTNNSHALYDDICVFLQ